MNSDRKDGPGPRAKRAPIWFYGASLVLAPMVFLGVLEIALRIFGIGLPSLATDPSRGFLPFHDVFEERVNEAGEGELVVKTPPQRLKFIDLRQFNAQRFPADRDPEETRILFIGGSLVYGWPFDHRLSFSRLFEVGLNAVAPERDWRILNMGAPGWGSTRITALAPQLIRFDPDLVVITIGNNEALEAAFFERVLGPGQGPVREVSWLTAHSHLATLISSWMPVRSSGDAASSEIPLTLHPSTPNRDAVIADYAQNLKRLANIFRDAGTRVVLTNVPVNLRGCPPLRPDGPGEGEQKIDAKRIARYYKAQRILVRGEALRALTIVDELIAQAPESASLHHLRARALDRLHRKYQAAIAYRRALNLDASMLRAFDALNEESRRRARLEEMEFVDFVSAINEISRDGIPGDEVFIDNCHVRSRGAEAMAVALARGIHDDLELQSPENWESLFELAIQRYLEDLKLPPELRAQALKFNLVYHRNRNPLRARKIEEAIQRLDPEGRLVDKGFRRRYFAAQDGSSSSRP